MSRPSLYTPQIVAKICIRLINGRSLRAICSEDDDMPSASTVYSWLAKNKEFSEQYAHAREIAAEIILDEILYIADNVPRAHGALAQARLRIDARKWVLGRMAPKKYGKHTG